MSEPSALGAEEQIAAARDGARDWLHHTARLSARGVAWAGPRGMLVGLCASALVPVALAEPGLMALAAGLNVVGSVGANVLADIVGASLAAARARTRAYPEKEQADDPEQVREEIAARLEAALAVRDQQAEELSRTLAVVLERIGAGSLVVSEAVAGGQAQLLRHLTAGFAELSGFGPLLKDLDAAIVKIQQNLAWKDAEYRFDRAQAQRQMALLEEVHEQLSELTHPLRPLGSGSASSALWEGRCPYQGLAPYGSAHAAVFHGRGQDTARLLRMVATHSANGPIIVTGVSGSGKSSLLHAGLLPAMGAPGTAYGTANWPQITFTPGIQPLRELATQLAVRCSTDPDQVLAELRADPAEAALRRARQVLTAEQIHRRAQPGDGTARLVVAVDQFEELFTLAGQGDQPADVEKFVAALEALATPAGPVVVSAIRGDFLDRCSAYPVLARALEEQAFVLAPMSEQDLRRVITGPAAAAGLRVQDGLASQIVDDLVAHVRGAGSPGQAGALPLLSMAMVRIWVNREGTRLTHASYDRAGGITSALTDTAEDTYARLDPPLRQIARCVLTALTITGADGQTNRRGVPLKELTSRSADGGRVLQVVEAFTGARLMIAMAAPSGGMVELAHDLLLSAWPRLRSWLADDQAERILHGQLVRDATAWEECGRDPAFLYRGSRLEDARNATTRWRADPGRYPAMSMPMAVGTFLLFSDRAAARGRRLSRTVIALLAGLLVISIMTALAAVRFGREADRQRAFESRRSAQILSRQAAAHSQAVLGDPVTSARLAVAAWAISPTDEAAAGLTALLSRPQRAVLTGHGDTVRSVAYSPDGTQLTTADQGGALRVWDARTGALIGTQHAESVDAMAYSPGGSRLATAGRDGTVRIRDSRTGVPVGRPITAHTGRVWGIAYSPDGTRLATAGNDTTVRLWDTRTGTQVGSAMTDHTKPLTAVAYSPDGTQLATAGEDNVVRIWNTRTGVPVGRLITAHTGRVWGIAYSPDGTRLATAGNDTTVRLWDTRTGAQVGKPLIGHTDWVGSIAYSRDGTRLASGSGDHTVRLWDARTGAPIGKPLTDHTGKVWSVAFSPDGIHLASGSGDRTVRVWDTRTGTSTSTSLARRTGRIVAQAFSPDRTRLATGGKRAGRIWDARTGTPIGKPLTGHTGHVWSVTYSPDGTRLATGSEDTTVRIWDASTGAPIGKPLTGHTGWVWSVAFSPDGTRLASASEDSTVRLWDTRTGTPIGQPLTGHTGPVGVTVFSPDGTRLATSSEDTTVRLWNAHTGAAIGEPLTGHTSWVGSIAYSPDGARLATGSEDNSLRIWDTRTGTLIGTPLTGHTGTVAAVAFSPDGTRLASSGGNGAVRVWDARTGTPIGTPLTGHTGTVTAATFSPDGTRLITAAEDKTVRVWEVALPSDLLNAACAIAGRGFTAAEWRRRLPDAPHLRTCPPPG
ncbi:WD40 repeat domain-containing protein [Nonomuraea endophytica]|uniref:WD40 repeat protein n=1 Tax=Nonomuraea endophytica TaxID=714136 RepID=A0A7W8EK67_9ACTN|nr:WD40 repeat domain-containing protein [Nonomuraea endophytica]MBB5082286.1 WD40 repeat protein [Nonomuraea endophytica]